MADRRLEEKNQRQENRRRQKEVKDERQEVDDAIERRRSLSSREQNDLGATSTTNAHFKVGYASMCVCMPVCMHACVHVCVRVIIEL